MKRILIGLGSLVAIVLCVGDEVSVPHDTDTFTLECKVTGGGTATIQDAEIWVTP